MTKTDYLATFKIEWEEPLHPIGPDDNPKARLLGCVRILGTLFHVNAEQVQDVNDEQTTVLPEGDTFGPEIWELTAGAGQTVTIEGREYLLVISPYSR